MLKNIPRISVMIISYKQEGIIHRALDSLIAQMDYLFEICVSDDCSPDSTWNVLQDYQNKYPNLIKTHQNESNLGIFENIERVYSMPTGDVVYIMAGDDEVGEGWFKSVIDFINEKKINWRNELFCIYGDYKCIYPNGDSIVHKHKVLLKYDDAFRLALRGVINNRGCCYSKRILDKFKKVSQGRSHIAENAQDRQLQIFTNTNYYIPKVGNIYYSQIGVSTHLNDEMKKERLQIWPYSIRCFKECGKNMCRRDLTFIKHGIALQEYHYWGSKKQAFLSIWYYLCSFDLKIFFLSDTIRGLVFAIRRRLPHKHIINMT